MKTVRTREKEPQTTLEEFAAVRGAREALDTKGGLFPGSFNEILRFGVEGSADMPLGGVFSWTFPFGFWRGAIGGAKVTDGAV